MSKRKVCKKCKFFSEEDKCPNCGSTDFTTNWNGRVGIIGHKESLVAQKLAITLDGEYAIKVR